MVGGDSMTWGPDYYSGGSSYYTYSTTDYYGDYVGGDPMTYGPDYYTYTSGDSGYVSGVTSYSYSTGGVVYGGDPATYGPGYYTGGYDYYSDGGYVGGVTSYSYSTNYYTDYYTDYYSGGYVSGVTSYSSGGMTGGGVYSEDAKPSCDIEGWDCDCEPKSPIDPFSRKPVPGGGY